MSTPEAPTTSSAEELANDAGNGLEEDEALENEGGEGGEEEADGEDEGDEELGAPGKKALERERAARKEAERELKKLRRDGEDESAKALREATEAVETKYHGLMARAAFRAELAEAGLRKGQDKMLRLLDLESIEVDEDGTVEGVAEQVKALRAEFPELFSRTREAAGRGDGGRKGEAPSKKLTSAERLALQAGIGGE